MVGTRGNPHCKLDKDFLQSRAPGNIKRHKRAKHSAPSLSSSQPSSSPPLRVAGRPLLSTPPITPIINLTGGAIGKPITRRDRPTCLDYGNFCRFMDPGGFFCSPCDEWEEKLFLKSHLNNQIRGKKYACKCEHTSFVEPAVGFISSNNVPRASNMPHPLPTKYKKYDPSVLLRSSDLESDGEIEDDNPSWFVDDNQSTLRRTRLLVEEDSKPAAQTTTPKDQASSAFGNQTVSVQKDVHDISMEDDALSVDGIIGAVH